MKSDRSQSPKSTSTWNLMWPYVDSPGSVKVRTETRSPWIRLGLRFNEKHRKRTEAQTELHSHRSWKRWEGSSLGLRREPRPADT